MAANPNYTACGVGGGAALGKTVAVGGVTLPLYPPPSFPAGYPIAAPGDYPTPIVTHPTWSLNIAKIENGWLVYFGGKATYAADGEEVAKTIVALIVAEKLEG